MSLCSKETGLLERSRQIITDDPEKMAREALQGVVAKADVSKYEIPADSSISK